MLSQIARQEADYLSAIYNSMRALSCAYPSSSSETRESLINLFQKIRMKDIEESKLEINEQDNMTSKKRNYLPKSA